MRVLVVADFDSFLRAGDSFARRLHAARGANVHHAIVHARVGQISDKQYRSLGFDRPLTSEPLQQIVSKSRLGSFDIIVLALNGMRTRRFMNRFRRLWGEGDKGRPIVVSLYPGLIFRFHLEGWQSRQSCDLLLLNSPKDLALYEEMLRSLGIEGSNAMCAGLSFLPSEAEHLELHGKRGTDVVFVGQPTVPAGRIERLYVVHEMVRLARKFPNTKFVIKPRHRPEETTLHKVRHHYQDLVEDEHLRLPANLGFSYESMERVLGSTGLVLTFSSTAALEAIARGIPTRVLTDLGINENIGNHFFMGSGVLADFSDIEPGLPHVIERQWYEANAASAGEQFEAVLTRIDSLLASASQRSGLPESRLFGRAPSFTRFVEQNYHWSTLEVLGNIGTNLRSKARDALQPLHRAILRRIRS